MKTPREILLQRHQAAELKLDAIRREIITEEFNNQATKKQSWLNGLVPLFLCCSKNFWRELIWPCHRIWAVLAAVWVLLLVANVSMRDSSQIIVAETSPTPEMILSFRQQEKILAELIGPNETHVPRPPKPSLPRPSSERRFGTLIT